MAATRPRKNRRPVSGAPALQSRPVSPPALTVDKKFEEEIVKLVKQFIGRSLLISAIILAMCEYALQRSHSPQTQLAPYVALSAFAVAFPYVRGAARAFAQIKLMGRKRCEAKKYADARFALEYFHRFGQMSFDRDGEAHYFLIKSYIGLGELDKAILMERWLKKNRSKYQWCQKASAAVEAAEKAAQRGAAAVPVTENS